MGLPGWARVRQQSYRWQSASWCHSCGGCTTVPGPWESQHTILLSCCHGMAGLVMEEARPEKEGAKTSSRAGRPHSCHRGWQQERQLGLLCPLPPRAPPAKNQRPRGLALASFR